MNPLDTTFGAVLLISVLIIAVQFLYHPVVLTEHVYRALLLPFLLGLLVPLFTFISYWSFRWHAPIVVVAILIIAFLTPDTADVRTLQKDGERQTLEAAVSQWAKANGCDVAVTDPEGKCPSPIIVSVAGGASRSAFLFGAVVGKLLDETHAKDGTPLRPFGAQLFAISGVSGGSFGASVTYAALADSITKGGGSRGQAAAPPCKPQVHDTEWFGHHMHPEPHPETSWRACLESILAGDFLSPVMVSLFTTDLVGIAPRGDRAVILENAWERRYAHYTGQDPETTTLAQPLIRVRREALSAAATGWLPMLLLGGTFGNDRPPHPHQRHRHAAVGKAQQPARPPVSRRVRPSRTHSADGTGSPNVLQRRRFAAPGDLRRWARASGVVGHADRDGPWPVGAWS